MQHKQVANLQDFLAHGMWEINHMLYRSVTDATYQLTPTIGRLDATSEHQRQLFERSVFDEFKRRALPYLKQVPAYDFEWLFLARHYGLPTRLLDWSTNPLVAVFFACQSETTGTDFAVYRKLQNSWITPHADDDPFDPYKGEAHSDEGEIWGLRPSHADQRFINQAGVFTWRHDPTIPVDDDSIIKYTFPSNIRSKTAWQVRKYGMSHAFIYGSLDGVAEDVRAEHERILRGGSFDSTTPLFG